MCVCVCVCVQCSSTVLTTYLPIFMYMYMFHLALPFVMFLMSCIKFQTFPARFIRIKLPGLWWPHYWLKNSEEMLTFEDEDSISNDVKGVATPRRMINCKTVVTQIIHHLCVLLTFGLCSPQLAIAVMCAILVTSDLLQLMIGRFVHFRLHSLVGEGVSSLLVALELASTDHALCALSEQLTETIILVKGCYVPILTTSTLFVCFICFDMSGDVHGWRDSLWVPITFACLYVALAVGRRSLRKYFYFTTKKKNPSMFDCDGNHNSGGGNGNNGNMMAKAIGKFELEAGSAGTT
jgi:hypothetical protein